MRLDKVEIVGFKSFCDKQEVSFKGGVTGIVGPNGCGKSNISDAINWVLGEQSAKSLRGSSMEDVIFAGSQARQPMAMAEVSLQMSGLNGNSPDGSPECVVTRRLYRNGESEYLMNGAACRLRDIHELFMDTGLGSKAYSIIEQGKIGLILSSKPADRRALIEEAAGITKYRVKRRQTQLKLEAAQQNLLRVNDIVHEVEKQLDSMKRQAAKARRYRTLREEIQGRERVLYGRRFLALTEADATLARRLTEEQAREQAAARLLAVDETRVDELRVALRAQEEQLEAAKARLAELNLGQDRLEGKLGFCRTQIAEAETWAAEARAQAADLDARVRPLDETIETRGRDETRLREDLATAEAESASAESEAREASSGQAARERDQEAAREIQVGLMSRISALQNARVSVSAAAEQAMATLLKLAAEAEDMEREKARLFALRTEGERRQDEGVALLTRLVSERDDAQSRAEAARLRADTLDREAAARQSERDGLAGRLASLEEMVATHSAFDEGVRALLARPDGFEVLGVVADALETDSRHERAVEAFLGDRLQAVLVPDAAHALRGVRHLESTGAGRGAFLGLAQARTKAHCGMLRDIAAREASVLGLLGDVYRATGPHADKIRASLPDALVVETLEDAYAVVARHGPVACVTLAGEVVRGAIVEGGRGVKGLLAPRREVREVRSHLEQIDAALAALRDRARDEAARAEGFAAEAKATGIRIHDREKELVAVRRDLAAAEEEVARLARKTAVVEIERRQAEDEKASAIGRLAEIDKALAAAEGDKDRGSERLAALGTAVAEARARTEAAHVGLSEVRSRLAALRERLAASEAEARRLSQDRTELLERIGQARRRAEEMEARRSELLTESAAAERDLADAAHEGDQAAASVLAVEDRVRACRNEIEGAEQGLKERRHERDAVRDSVQEVEVTRARIGSDLDHIARECHQAIGQTAAEAAVTLTEEDGERDLAALEAEVAEIRDRIERMGPVNVLAVEQLQELEERDQFMTAQRQDLLDSIAELDSAIRRIDRVSRERFREAFQVVNQHFGEVFRQLFGGGTAGLSLVNEEDVLESGIDIMAQPPGKRLQSVLLLSGGEKALTAIALLFAIFQYKPSPFCILDEVDAPLDDANIGRFVRMVDGLKEQTQFILITHSRKTMEIADQLYGVTMEEPGVSKLVSVRLG
jgi:chromosome segregation protein